MPPSEAVREVASNPPGMAGPALLLTGVVLFCALYAPQPMLPAIERLYAAPPGSAGAVMSAPLLALVLASWVYPRLRLRAGWVLGGGLAGVTVFGALAAYAPSLPLFVAFRFCQGSCIAAVPGLAFALVAHLYPDRTQALAGLLVSGNALGGALGRVLGGVVAELLGVREAILLLSLPSLPLGFVFLRDRTRFQLPVARHEGSAWSLYGVGATILFINLLVSNLLPYHLERSGWGQARIGVFYLAYLAGIAGASLGGIAAGRLGAPRALVSAFGLVLVSLVGMSLARSLLALFVGFVAMLSGLFAAQGIAGGVAGRRGGGVSGTYVSAYYLGGGVSGLCVPLLLPRGFTAGLGVAVLVAVGALGLSRRALREPDPAGA